MKEADDCIANVKDRAKLKLERDMGPLLMNALNGLLIRIEGRPQSLWQQLVGDPDLEVAGRSFFDRRHMPIVVMGRRRVNGQLAVSGVAHHTFCVVRTLFELAQT